MPKTSTTFQWDSGRTTFQEAATRSLFSTDIVRWQERTPRSAPGSAIEPSGTDIKSQTLQNTVIAPKLEILIPRVKKTDATYKGNFILLKKYNGFVSFKGEQSFTARLYESGSDYPVLEAVFDLEELSEIDRELAVEGAALVWTIGYHDEESRKRESMIYMRRRPGWDEKEIEQAKQAANKLTCDIQWK